MRVGSAAVAMASAPVMIHEDAGEGRVGVLLVMAVTFTDATPSVNLLW